MHGRDEAEETGDGHGDGEVDGENCVHFAQETVPDGGLAGAHGHAGVVRAVLRVVVRRRRTGSAGAADAAAAHGDTGHLGVHVGEVRSYTEETRVREVQAG